MNAPTFRAAHDICDASSLDALGWGFSLKGYRVMRILIAFLAFALAVAVAVVGLSLIHISEPTRLMCLSRMPSSA